MSRRFSKSLEVLDKGPGTGYLFVPCHWKPRNQPAFSPSERESLWVSGPPSPCVRPRLGPPSSSGLCCKKWVLNWGTCFWPFGIPRRISKLPHSMPRQACSLPERGSGHQPGIETMASRKPCATARSALLSFHASVEPACDPEATRPSCRPPGAAASPAWPWDSPDRPPA